MKRIILSVAMAATVMFMHETQAQNWSLTGNAGTNPANNFIGTTDPIALKFRTNNTVRMTLSSKGRLGIGVGNPLYRLDVAGGTEASDTIPVINALVKKTGNFDIVGIRSTSAPAAFYGIGMEGNGNFIGMKGQGGLYGMVGVGGILGVSGNVNNPGGFLNITGVQGLTAGGNIGIGVYGSGSGSSMADYGIYGEQQDTASNDYAVVGIGDVFAWRYFSLSDRKLKNNIQPVTNALDKIRNIHAFTYTFNQAQYTGKKLPWGTHIGFMADEIEQAFPELVKNTILPAGVTRGERGKLDVNTIENVKVVNYLGMIPVIVEAINEQRAIVEQKEIEITQLRSQLQNLEQRLAALESARKGSVNATETQGYLNQNNPNPFNQQTIISFSLPENAGKGILEVADANGRVVKSFAVKGTGQVELKARSLSPGIYIYRLISNGQTLDSKQMVITE
jgi:hypothetical protein